MANQPRNQNQYRGGNQPRQGENQGQQQNRERQGGQTGGRDRAGEFGTTEAERAERDRLRERDTNR